MARSGGNEHEENNQCARPFDLKESLRELLNESVVIYALVQTAPRGRGDRQRSADIESRLEQSVMRPLKDALCRLGDTETQPEEAAGLASPGLVSTDLDEHTGGAAHSFLHL